MTPPTSKQQLDPSRYRDFEDNGDDDNELAMLRRREPATPAENADAEVIPPEEPKSSDDNAAGAAPPPSATRRGATARTQPKRKSTLSAQTSKQRNTATYIEPDLLEQWNAIKDRTGLPNHGVILQAVDQTYQDGTLAERLQGNVIESSLFGTFTARARRSGVHRLQLNYYTTESQRAKLDEIADELGTSRSHLVETALQLHLSRENT